MLIQEYQDPKIGKYLRYGFWYMEHKGVIDRTLRLLMVLVVVGIWFGAMYQFYSFLQGSVANEAMLRNLVSNGLNAEQLHNINPPQLLVVSQAFILPGRDEFTADFMAWAENPNPDWYLEVDYIFSWSDGQTLARSAFILPQTKIVLLSSGVTVNSLPQSAEVVATPKKWLRLKDKDILRRLADFKEKVTITQTQVVRDGTVTSAAFSVQNNTIYDLLTPRLVVVLLQAEIPVGAGMSEIESLLSGETKTLEQRWLQSLPINLTLQVQPQINALDGSTYRLPKGGETKF